MGDFENTERGYDTRSELSANSVDSGSETSKLDTGTEVDNTYSDGMNAGGETYKHDANDDSVELNTEKLDADSGNNEFDADFKELNTGTEPLEFSKIMETNDSDRAEMHDDSLRQSDMTTEESVDYLLSGFDESDDVSNPENNTDVKPDESVDDISKEDPAIVDAKIEEPDVAEYDEAVPEDLIERSELTNEIPYDSEETLEANVDQIADAADNPDNTEELSENGVEGAEATSDLIQQENEEGISDESINDADEAETGTLLDNVSYQQGKNDFGAQGTCGPTTVANALNRITGTSEYTENGVLHSAMNKELCNKSDNPYDCGATTTKEVVQIIDEVKDPDSNIQTEVFEYEDALSVDELADRVDDPNTVAIVGVDSATLWDERGDVCNSGLFQPSESEPSDHWILVDSSERDDDGNVTGFNIVDSGGGESYSDTDKFVNMYQGSDSHKVSDPTAIIVTNNA